MTELVVEFVWSEGPRSVHILELRLPLGSTVGDALVEQTLMQRLSASAGLSVVHGGVSIWGRSVTPLDVLKQGDRLELCRPLRVDPKTARRERFRSQGARSAGLFKSRRPGAKAGY